MQRFYGIIPVERFFSFDSLLLWSLATDDRCLTLGLTLSPLLLLHVHYSCLPWISIGDLSAESDSGRLYSIFFLLIGLAAVTSVISGWMNRLLEGLEAYLLKQPDEPRGEEGAVDEDEEMEKQSNAYRYRKIVFSIIIIAICIIAGTIFMCVTHEWTFLQALYWSFVTVLTVGYGDLDVRQNGGILFFISIFMMLSTMCVAVALGNFVEVTVEIEQEERKKKALEELDLTELILSDAGDYNEVHKAHLSAEQGKQAGVTSTTISPDSGEAGNTSPRAQQNDMLAKLQGRKVSKCDFMLFMLEKLNNLDRKKDIDPLLRKFDKIDVDRNEKLDIIDIQTCSEMFEEEKRGRKEKEIARKKAGLFGFLYRGDNTPKGTASIHPKDMEAP